MPTTLARLSIERLEERWVPSGTQYDQLLFELINYARAHPQELADRLLGGDLNQGLPPGTISPDPKQPLAWEDRLFTAAFGHSTRMLTLNFFDHIDPYNGSTPGDRADLAGYVWTSIGENLAFRSSMTPVDVAQVVRQMHEDLFISPTHRRVMLDPDYEEGAAATVQGSFTWQGTTYPYTVMATEMFGNRDGRGPFLLGVVVDDQNHNGAYDPGEGLGNVQIVATHLLTGQQFSTTSSATGGYRLELPPGDYRVMAARADFTVHFSVSLGTQNVKRDVFKPDQVTDIDSFGQSGDLIGAGTILPGVAAAGVVLINADLSDPPAVLVFNAVTGNKIAAYDHPLGGFDGWVDPTDKTLFGDVNGDGVVEIIQINGASASGAGLGNAFLRVVEARTGRVLKLWNYDDLTPQGSYRTLFAGLVDPEDVILVGHFTRVDHLEALFFNRTAVTPDTIALRTLDLVTGQVTFTSYHDGVIFGGWTDPTDEAVASDMNGDGFDDLILVNRVPDPQNYRTTNKGFIGMVSLADAPGVAAGPYRGFYRFFDWNFARPGENSVFPGYDEIGDHVSAGHVINDGQRQSVLLLVNSSSATQAAYAILQPRPLTPGVRDSFQLISTIFHGSGTAGAFDSDDVFVMADVNGDGSDDVISLSRINSSQPKAYVRTFHALTGARLGQVPGDSGGASGFSDTRPPGGVLPPGTGDSSGTSSGNNSGGTGQLLVYNRTRQAFTFAFTQSYQMPIYRDSAEPVTVLSTLRRAHDLLFASLDDLYQPPWEEFV